MVLNLQTALDCGLVRELARILDTPDRLNAWIAESGFPREHVPLNAPSAYALVCEVFRGADHGLIRGGVSVLLGVGLRMFPHNEILLRASGRVPTPDLGHVCSTIRPSVEGIREAVAYLVREELRIAEIGSSALPPRLVNGNPEGAFLSDIVDEWTRGSQPAVSLLVAAPGEGKTVSTCLIQRHLADSDPGAVALWVPFRRADLFDLDPDHGISRALHLPEALDVWGQNAGVRWLILDGLDEAISKFTWPTVRRWLDVLLDRVANAAARPSVIVSGRDITLLHTRVQQELMARLRAFAGLRSSAPSLLRTMPWTDGELRTALSQRLRERRSAEEVDALMSMLAPGLLTSPLLFRSALETLISETTTEGPLDSEWALMSEWISRLLCANFVRHPGRNSVEARRRAASSLALLLARSGRGMAGATLTELEQSSEMQRAWFSLAGSPEELDELRWELTVGCLLRCEGDRLTFLHEQMLIHLAAEAVVQEPRLDDRPDPPDPPANVWTLLEKTAAVGEGVLAGTSAAAQPGSAWARVWGHVARRYARGDRPLALDSRADARSLWQPSIDLALSRPSDHVSLSLRLAARDAIVSACAVAPPSHAPTGTPEGSLPEGNYPVWRDQDGVRTLGMAKIPRGIRIADMPCTVREYAAFLDAHPKHALPNQPGALWRREDGKARYDDRLADAPASGISLADARAYCRWLSANSPDHGLIDAFVRLPHPDWLRVAALGMAAAEPRGQDGAFGHRGLLATVWQWTDGGSHPEVFGGSSAIGLDSPDGGVKAVLQAWPDLCRTLPAESRDPHVGFRVCWVPIELAGLPLTESTYNEPIVSRAPAHERSHGGLLNGLEFELPDGSLLAASNVPSSLRIADLLQRLGEADPAIEALVSEGVTVTLARGRRPGRERVNVRLTLDAAALVNGDRLRLMPEATQRLSAVVHDALVGVYDERGRCPSHALRVGLSRRAGQDAVSEDQVVSILRRARREQLLGDFALLAALDWPGDARVQRALGVLTRLHPSPREAGPRAWITLLDDDRARLLETWREATENNGADADVQ